MKRDNAFTGLEAAIVLIAFVVVAAVFSYVMLGAGFFATQKAQEVTYAGIKQATSNVVFEGHMYGNVTTPGSKGPGLVGLTFSIKVPGGGQNIDMSTTTFVYTSEKTTPPLPVVDKPPLDIDDIIEYPQKCDSSTALSGAPQAQAYFPDKNSILSPGASAIYTLCLGEELNAGDWFSIEMIPAIGAPTLVTKRIDAGLINGKPLL
ncbi:MAG: flagellin [Euryarchaeota archaeon]|nr:flagellin [Euryarchaeota archaeon]